MENNKSRMSAQTVFTLAVTALLCLAVHGYRFANSMFSHDSLLVIVQEDAAWQIELGRFFQPFIVFFKGRSLFSLAFVYAAGRLVSGISPVACGYFADQEQICNGGSGRRGGEFRGFY